MFSYPTLIRVQKFRLSVEFPMKRFRKFPRYDYQFVIRVDCFLNNLMDRWTVGDIVVPVNVIILHDSRREILCEMQQTMALEADSCTPDFT